MSTGSAFQTLGKTVAVSAGVTAASNLIRYQDLGLVVGQAPQSLRVVNNGTADVWMQLSATAQTAAFPAAGAGAGTPAYGVRLKPGVIEIFGLNFMSLNPNNEQPIDPGFFVNTISGSAGQIIEITGGEGL